MKETINKELQEKSGDLNSNEANKQKLDVNSFMMEEKAVTFFIVNFKTLFFSFLFCEFDSQQHLPDDETSGLKYEVTEIKQNI